MNQNASSLSNTSLSSVTDTASLLTTVHLVWIAVFALIVIVGIVYGARLSARRKAAERRVREHVEEAGVETVPADEAAEPTSPAAPPTPPPADPSPPQAVDDGAAAGPVSQLKGLGPKVAARLAELGVTSVGQLAALDHDAAQALDDQLGPFRGRMERDRWIEQARFLAAGDVKGFEAVFGKL